MKLPFPVAFRLYEETGWHWAKQPFGSVRLPDFIQKRAKGEALMVNGHVYLKAPGSDPDLVKLFNQRIKETEEAMQKAIADQLYGDKGRTGCRFSVSKIH